MGYYAQIITDTGCGQTIVQLAQVYPRGIRWQLKIEVGLSVLPD